MSRDWVSATTVGTWYKIGLNALRFYMREHVQTGELWYFADYRAGDLVSRFHKLLPAVIGDREGETANELSLRLATLTAEHLNREDLVLLDQGRWMGAEDNDLGWMFPEQLRCKAGEAEVNWLAEHGQEERETWLLDALPAVLVGLLEELKDVS